MSTITKRGNSFTVQIRKKGFNLSKSFKTLKEAQNFARQIESKIDSGDMKPVMPLSVLIQEYKKTYMTQKGLGTQKMQISQLEIWLNLIGDKDVSCIKASDINRAKIKLASGDIQKSTVNRYLQALSPIFTFAIELGYIEKNDNPFSGVKKFKEPNGRTRYLSQDEITRLLRECKRSESKHLYNVVCFALATGMRYGEIMGLKRENIDLENNLITLNQTKNGSIRTIPMSENLRNLILKNKTGHFIFESDKTQKPVLLLPAFKNAVKRAQIKNFRFHDIRHTAASYLAMSGANLLTIAEILGHKTLSMVKRYAHLTESFKGSELEKLQQNCNIFPDK